MTAAHPARWSPQIIDVLRTELAGAPWVHDPFAGTGERLGALCDEIGVEFSGTELEEAFIVDPRVVPGDSRDNRTYPRLPWPAIGWGPYWIVTSPVYPNGMADHFVSSGVCSFCAGNGGVLVGTFWEPDAWSECSKCDGTGRRAVRRHTYRQAVIGLTGDPDYALDEGNMGRYSVRGGSKAEERYWGLAREVCAQWGGAERVILNTKDFYVARERYHLWQRWNMLLVRQGWTCDHLVEVPCPGNRNGANRGLRMEHEDVAIYVRK